MPKQTRTLLVVGIVVFTVLCSQFSFAKGPLYDVSKECKITRKLLRGLANIPFSIMEIPLEINKQIQMLDPFTGFWVGLGRGSVQTWKRAVTGVWEVLTFPIEVPEGYRPIMEPEFPMMDLVD